MGFLLKICWSIEKYNRHKKAGLGACSQYRLSYVCYMAKAIQRDGVKRLTLAVPDVVIATIGYIHNNFIEILIQE